MISKDLYKLLKNFYDCEIVDLDAISYDIDTFLFALKQKFLIGCSAIRTRDAYCYTQAYISDLGKLAVEEYERNIDLHKIEKESIVIAKEANNISKQSNNIAQKANNKSHISNIIAIVSSLISAISLIVAIIALAKG